MSFEEEYYKLRKKRKEEEEEIAPFIRITPVVDVVESGIPEEESEAPRWSSASPSSVSVFSAPVVPKTTTKKEEEKEKWYEGWFQKGDEDVAKAILGTSSDAGTDFLTGLVGMGEKVVDFFAGIAPYVAQGNYYANGGGFNIQADQAFKQAMDTAKAGTKEFIEKDLYDEESVAKEIISNVGSAAYMYGINQSGAFATPDQVAFAQGMAQEHREYIDKEMEEDSVLGHKSDSLIQSAGQLTGIAALSAVGVPWWLTTGATSWGAESENALKQGATLEEANLSGAVSAGAEILTEKISGGISFGGKTLDDGLTSILAANISNKFWRTAAKLGLDAFGEGAEEWISQDISTFGQWLTYQKEEDLKDLLFSEEAMDAKIEAFLGGAALGGFSSVSNTMKSKANGKDAVSGLTKNEQAVVDKVYKDRVAEAEKDGTISPKKKAEIFDEVVEEMEKGYISTDTIEEVLGGESYKTYKDSMDSGKALLDEQKALQEEFKTLNQLKQGEMTGEQIDRRAELKKQLEEIKLKIDDPNTKAQNDLLQAQLHQNVYEMTKGDRLRESYFERVRSSQKYEADLSQYTGKARDVIQKVMESGLADNSNQSHEFWDMAANLAAGRNIDITIATNEELMEMLKEEHKAKGKEFDESKFKGQIIDGYFNGKGIVLNAKTKRALNFVVGHEITHSLEGTEHYKSLRNLLFEYAKGEYETRYNQRAGQYANKFTDETFKEDVDKEVTADLVGDILFTDKDFIKHLTKDRNVFQKVWDEVKYLAKMATAGSDQARQLEKVKREFEKAWQEAGKESGKGSGDVQLSISETTDGRFVAVVDSDILSNIDTSKWDKDTKNAAKKAASKELKKFSNGFIINGIEYVGNKVARGEYTRSDYSEALARKNPTAYLDKMRAASVLDDVIRVATDWKNDGELKYDRDDYVDFVRGKTLIMSGDRAYSAIVLAGITEDGKAVFHDVEDVYPDSFELKKSESSTTVSANQLPNSILEDSDAPNIAQNGSDVKPQFSVSDSDGNQLSVSEEQNQQGLDRGQEVVYSISNDSKYMDKAIAKNEANKGYAYHVDTQRMEEAKAIRERIAARMNEIRDKGLVALPEDIEGNTYIANSSYDGTEENTTICPRSLASEAFVDAVSEYLGRPLTVEEQIYISQDLQGRSLTPECTYCYVATDRKAYRAFLGEYINQRDAVIEKLSANPNADVSRSGELYKQFLGGRKDTNPMYNRFKMWVDAYKNGTPMVDASHLANMNRLMGDINSEFGAELKPQIVDAMKYAQSASWAKKRVNYVAYNGHILNWKQDRINKLNSHYGLRMYSFSDFHPAFVLENMQMITDASVRGLKMLGYTKDADFVEIFAPSGMNINVSTFGFEVDGNVYENNIIGAEWAKAQKLRAEHPNVGITFVATNDTLVEWALAQDWIDVVIPYHLVRTGAEVAKAFNYTNYTSESSDTKTKEWVKGDKKYIAPTEHNNDKATYLAALAKNHLKPRFERFIDNPNYMKLVNECRQSASESKPVQPVFNEEAAMTALAKLEANGYYQPIGGSVERMYEIAAQVAEDMTAPVQASISDEGQTSKGKGWNVYAKDILLDKGISDDIAPLPSETESAAGEVALDDIAPVQMDIGNDMDAPIATVRERLEAKQKALQTELAENQRLRAESTAELDGKIAQLQAEYDGKKNKDTKYAHNLLRRIEGLKRRKASIDADYAKHISDLEKRIKKTEGELQKDHTKQDRLERAINRIDKMLEYDKTVLDEEFAQRRESLADKNSYISQKASELYNEIRNLKKGVRASKMLGELLDTGYEWSSIKAALVNIKHTPAGMVNAYSEAESAARELLNEDYENSLHDLDDAYAAKVKELEAGAETKRKNARTAEQRKIKQGEYADQMAELIGDTTTWVDKKMGIQYEVNTLRRNLRDIVRDADGKRDIAKADAIYDELQGKYNSHEAMLNKESNRIKQPYADMKFTRAEDVYIQMLGEFRHNPDTTLTEDAVKEFYQKHKDKIDTAKVDKAIEMARETYDTLLERVNEVLRGQGMKEIPYRKGYFPHFTDEKQSFLAKLFNWKVKSNDIPTDIAGLTEQFNPNRSWQSFNKQRMSDTTDYSFTRGLDTYVQGALDWVYHIEDIQKRRAFENHIRYVHSEKGVQEKIDAIRASEEYDADEVQEQIELVLKEAGNPLGNFVTDFRTGTNTLANKKSSMDRGLEQKTNRKVYSVMTNISNRVSANMVGGSISSALTNFIPITQSWGDVSPLSSLRAMADTIRSAVRDDGTIEKSDFLTNRLRGADNLYQTTWDKVTDKAGIMMEAVDSFTSQVVWRSKYQENIANGMSESEAIKNADQFAENVIAGRSRGNMPTIFDSKNPLTKIFTAFQLEVANQYGYMLKDMPQDMKNESVGKLVKGYATMFLGAYAYNALYSSLVGRDAAFDPVGIVEGLLRDLGWIGDDEEEEPVDILMNLTESVLEEVPFVGGLLGGGRIPISSALPYDGNILDAVEGTGKLLLEGDTSQLTEWLNPVYYLAMPMGGGQLRKTVQGLSMFSEDHPVAGSYTDSGALRFPVDDTWQNRLQAGLFGQWANENAQDYINNGRRPLEEKQIREFIDVGMTIQDYWEYRDGLSGLNTLAEKADYIDSLNLTTAQKNVLINNLAGREDDIDMSDYGEYGSFEEFDFASKNPEKYSFFRENGISYDAYASADEDGKRAYTWAYENPGKYEVSKAISDDLLTYRQYNSELNGISADRDEDGNVISGSAKEKKIAYINGLDLEYGQKIILFRSLYKSDDTYNYEIIDYLNSREDISAGQMRTILEELGFMVDSEGYITWD